MLDERGSRLLCQAAESCCAGGDHGGGGEDGGPNVAAEPAAGGTPMMTPLFPPLSLTASAFQRVGVAVAVGTIQLPVRMNW